jgi:serine phosphatase RsbU (regulator of sigma subunit)
MIYRISRSILVLFIFVLSFQPKLKAQNSGYPVRNYTPKECGAFPQNWSCVQDKRGVMYFGTSSVILEYDGKSWRKINVTAGVAVRSLFIDSSGIIYVGSVGDFGFLSAQKNGTLLFKSLINTLSKKEKKFADVWKIYKQNGSIIFQTSENLFLYKNNIITTISPTTSFALSFKINIAFYIRQRKIGLMKLQNQQLQLIPEGEKFADSPILNIIDYPSFSKTKHLVLTGNNGFYVIDDTQKSVFHLPSSAENYLNSLGVLGMEWYDDSTIFINTRSGIVFLNENLQLKKLIDKSDGLGDESIAAMFFDSQKELWLCSNNGISKISIHSPLYYYDHSSGLSGNIQTIAIFNNEIYVGTTNGIYFAALKNNDKSGEPQKFIFNAVQGIAVEAWNFYQSENQLFAASSDGVYEIINHKAVRFSKQYANAISPSFNNKNRMYFGEREGLRVFEKDKNSKWKEAHFFAFAAQDIYYAAEIKNDASKPNQTTLWISTRNKGVMKLNFDEKYNSTFTFYDSTRGMPQENVGFSRTGTPIFIANSGVYKYVSSKDDGKQKCFEKTNGTIGDFNHNGTSLPLLDTKKSNGDRTFQAMLTMEEQGYSFYQKDSNILWIGLTDVLVRYDATVKKNYNTDYNTLIRRVTLANDSLLFDGAFSDSANRVTTKQSQQQQFELSFKNNFIEFMYAAPFFEREDKTEYSYRLIGFDTTWSDWSAATMKQFTNLSEGEYLFEVKAKNIYKKESSIAQYKFTVLPPWYRTFWAYVLYVVMLLLFVYIVVKISVRSLTAAKEKLERIVTERTSEIVKQKDELQEKSTIIEEAYNDIKSSINYAKRIQEAILPIQEDIKNSFSESFVLFKPRDIVSGDFYWFAKHGTKKIIACVDCTGHGVPGAFMSMIGNTLLNEIINEKGIYAPDKILNLLHERVRQSLKQDLENTTQTRDGMDISVCTIDTSNNTLQYAGANRALYIIRNNSLEEIKPNKFPIGGDQMEQDRLFTNHEITIAKNDVFYLSTDGYADQFGGEKGKKFMVKNFHKILLEIQHLPMEQQYQNLKTTIEDWRGNLEQVDDILVMGIKI